MKKIASLFCIALIGFAAAAFTFDASAQSSYGEVSLLAGGTNNIAAAQTNTYSGKLVSAKLGDEVGLFVSLKGVAATPGVPVATFVFDKSLDGVNFPTDTGNRFSFDVLLSGTSERSVVTNLNLGAIGFLRLREIRSTNSVALTNITVTAAVKNKFVR